MGQPVEEAVHDGLELLVHRLTVVSLLLAEDDVPALEGAAHALETASERLAALELWRALAQDPSDDGVEVAGIPPTDPRTARLAAEAEALVVAIQGQARAALEGRARTSARQRPGEGAARRAQCRGVGERGRRPR